MPVASLHAAAELLASADSTTGLAAIARSIGCDGDPAPLDLETRRALGLDDAVLDASVATGRGALRALLLTVRDDASLREVLPRYAGRLATRAAHALWVIVAFQGSRGEVAIAAWSADRRPPRVAAVVVDRRHPVDSDAETLIFFFRHVGSFSKTREDISTWMDLIDLDDFVTFGGKP